MKGNNELLINQATMVAAMQMYLDSIMKVAPLVKEVEREVPQGASYGAADSFRVKLTDREASCT